MVKAGKTRPKTKAPAPRPAKRTNRGLQLLMFLGVSLLAGVLAAGLAVPFAALAGVSTTVISESLDVLPNELAIGDDAMRSTVYLGDGSVLANFYEENRIILESISDIAPIMRAAQIDIEDRRFYSHGPMDLEGTVRALFSNVAGGEIQGGSTITQQYVKLVRVEAAVLAGDTRKAQKVQEASLSRKIEEMRYAISVEENFTKDEILRRYLNIAYYGDGVYGVEAAALHYFGVHAKDLTLSQAAMLAGIVQNPNYDPVSHPEEATARRNLVLQVMWSLRHIPRKSYLEAKAEVFDPTKTVPMGGGCANSRYPFICQYIEKSLYANPLFGATEEKRKQEIKRGGYQIYTKLNPTYQDLAQAAVSNSVAPTDPAIATITEIQPGTGRILAMAQSRPVMGDAPGETYYNYAVSHAMGGAEGFQAGSTFKVFAAAAALEAGVPPLKQFAALPSMNFTNRKYPDCDGSLLTVTGTWPVRNFGPSGTMDMYAATSGSVNTYYAQLVLAIGPCKAAQMAQALGVEMAMGGDLVQEFHDKPSFVLGVAETTSLSMANAYATFGARGKYCQPMIIEGVKDRDGVDLPWPVLGQDNCEQTVRPEVADGMNRILRGGVFGGYASGTRYDGRDQGGKTGTTEDNNNVWVVAYTPEISAASHVSVDTNPNYKDYWTAHNNDLRRVGYLPSGKRIYGQSSTDPVYIWRDAVHPIMSDFPATAFTAPPASILRGKTIKVPSLAGTPEEVKARLESNGFQVISTETFDTAPPGTYIKTTCEPYVGGLCSQQYSKGPRP